MRRQYYAEQTAPLGTAAESWLAAVQSSSGTRPMGATAWLPPSTLWTMDAFGGPMEGYFEPVASRPFRSHPYCEVTSPLVFVSVQQASDSMLHGLEVLTAAPWNAAGWREPPTPNTSKLTRQVRAKAESDPDARACAASVLAPEPPAYRKLFSDGAIRRVLSWGDWKEALEGQLAHPERLRESHRLPCTVQVIETHVQSRPESLSRLLFSGEDMAPRLIAWSPELGDRLCVAKELNSKPLAQTAKRLFFLRLESDPTAGTRAPVSTPPSPPVAREPKRTVPQEYIRGIHFPITRDEAIYDMQQPVSRLQLWRDVFKKHSAFKKWQCLLWGKNLEEQLWTVRPPKAMFHDARVRAWAEKTLDAAGYDKGVMLAEWEIYWRRHAQ